MVEDGSENEDAKAETEDGDDPGEADEEYGQNQYGGDEGVDAVEQTERMEEDEAEDDDGS